MRVAPLVVLGGAVGSLARYVVTDARSPGWVLAVNVLGALLLAVVVARTPDGSLLRPLLGTGVLGGWTTWSAAALVTARDLGDGRLAMAGGYLLASAVLGPLVVRATLRGRRTATS